MRLCWFMSDDWCCETHCDRAPMATQAAGMRVDVLSGPAQPYNRLTLVCLVRHMPTLEPPLTDFASRAELSSCR